MHDKCYFVKKTVLICTKSKEKVPSAEAGGTFVLFLRFLWLFKVLLVSEAVLST